MIVPLSHVMALAGVLFLIGMFTVTARRNLIMMLLGVEIMLNAGAIMFVGAALRWGQLEGQAFVIFILAVAAAEVSVGLAMIVRVHRRCGSIDPGELNLLK
ncbi:MAG: NADH-quinone oxidoreductase subunit NuoK [Desulfobacterales bacterium]|jgi:NADH-quinone oxidoreductase subunit K|nr:NADH-quinone oxidoreductase subunit NuoK [Desulfobacterales bacterium]